MRSVVRAVAAAGLILLAGAGSGRGEESAYGGTPASIRPYRDTGSHYWRFFEEPTPYRGVRRGPIEPDGLTAVKVGLIAPVENVHDARIGESMHRGALLAVDEANAAGGFRGTLPFKLVLRNDSGLWGASSNTTTNLVYDERVWGIVGSVDGANTHIALRVALKAEVPIVNTSCTDPTLTETAIPWMFRCYPDDRQHGYRLAQLLVGERGYKRVAVMRSNDKYGRMGVKEFTDAVRRLGFPIALEVRYLPGEEDFSSQLDRIQSMDADAVVLWSNAADAARIVTRMRKVGMEQPVFGPDRLVSRDFLEAAGDAARGVIATSPLDPDRSDGSWLAFRARYEERFGEAPDAFATFTYDGTRLLLETIDSAGLDRVRVRDELAALHTYEGVSGPMRFDTTHNNLGRICLLEVRDGRFEKLEE